MPNPKNLNARNWLEYRWAFEIRERFFCGTWTYHIYASDCPVSFHEDRDEARALIETMQVRPLSDIISEHPALQPVNAIISGGPTDRLGRIPPKLWPTYDGLLVGTNLDYITVLSAKARAMFPGQIGVFVRVHRSRAGALPEARW